MIIHPHKTALCRKKQSHIADLLANKGLLDNITSVFDYGCGYGADCEFYISRGLHSEGFDPKYNPWLPGSQQFDLVTMVYVLNVIPSEEDRITALQCAFSFLKPGGSFIVATRGSRDLAKLATAKNWPCYNDGYVTPKQTFQRGWEASDLLTTILPLFENQLLAVDVLSDTQDTVCVKLTKL